MVKLLKVILSLMVLALPVQAQDTSWVQVEAQPTLREAQERARVYGAQFGAAVNGFQLSSGWYAIAIGPFGVDEAPIELRDMRRAGQIPGDSFVADGGNYRQQFWPVGASAAVTPTPVEPAETAEVQEIVEEQIEEAVEETIEVAEIVEETPAEARRSERELDADGRKLLQEALQWEGFYNAGIDGAFGPGTRRAMSEYQGFKGYEATGILTTRQRAELVDGYRAQINALGLKTVEDANAGIRLTMPTAMVSFDRIEPPFIHYTGTAENGVNALLISQEGDQATLFGLYDIMQTLEIVPMNGERSRDSDSFTLTGQNADLHSYTYAALEDGTIKGFTLTWKPTDEKLMMRAVEAMRSSFEPTAGVLDETLGDPNGPQSVDLLAGLEIRRPDLSRSGFFIDGAGTVLTTTAAIAQCERVTIGDDTEVSVTAQDDALGLALLKPQATLAPLAYAAFQTGQPRLNTEVAVAGYSYGEVLDMPVLTYGQLSDVKGLAGEDSVNRLTLAALPGDAGGPVFDASGAVMGMLLPRAEDGRQLPSDVSFVAAVPAIADFISTSNLSVAASDASGSIAPEDLSLLAADMTVRISCWN